VPPWLLNTIYKCLQKAPENRFATGAALTILSPPTVQPIPEKSEPSQMGLRMLQQENEALRSEVAALKKQVAQYQNAAGSTAREIAALKNTIGQPRSRAGRDTKSQQTSYEAPPRTAGRKISSKIPVIALLVMACIGAFAAASFFRDRNPERTEPDRAATDRAADNKPFLCRKGK
jgi:hypothetical protein